MKQIKNLILIIIINLIVHCTDRFFLINNNEFVYVLRYVIKKTDSNSTKNFTQSML